MKENILNRNFKISSMNLAMDSNTRKMVKWAITKIIITIIPAIATTNHSIMMTIVKMKLIKGVSSKEMTTVKVAIN